MEEIINKINKNELIDEDDFRDTAYSFCQDKGFSYLLRDVTFDNNFYAIGAYRPKSRMLTFSFEKVNDLVYKSAKKILDIYKLPSEYLPLFINYYYLYVLYHELRHIEQDYNHDCNVNNNPVFSYLHDISTIAGRDEVMYNHFHDLFPIEIDANNYGFLYSYMQFLKTNIPDKDKQLLLLQVYNSILLQYKVDKKRIVSPIERFDEKVGYINLQHLYELMKKNKIDTFDKFISGLPVNKYEHYRLYVKKKRTLKTIIR